MGERRKYTAEFKREAVELRRTSDKTIAQIARELGISLKLLEGNRPALEAENARLRREVARLEQEREILKNALGIFSRGQ